MVLIKKHEFGVPPETTLSVKGTVIGAATQTQHSKQDTFVNVE